MNNAKKRALMRLYLRMRRTCTLLSHEQQAIEEYLRKGPLQIAARKIWAAIDACVVANEEFQERIDDAVMGSLYEALKKTGFIPNYELELVPRTNFV